MKTRTRDFQFPNQGHSVRKLAEALRELGDVKVKLVIQENVVYATTDSKWVDMNALKLADKLLTLGTRFTVVTSRGFPELSFYTDFTDIMAYPEAYGVA